ncbi:MAG: hypothetical protein HY001_04565 [Candidatus Portnoybacteria bacterium]|nr:hypothetical protein [Candidatus Portnoybacteria bacterium]
MNNSTIWWIILIVVVLLGAYFLFVNRQPVEAPGLDVPVVSEPVAPAPTDTNLPQVPSNTVTPNTGTDKTQ